MKRYYFALALTGLCMISAGCAVCASPYDDCSPTFLGGCDEYCNTDERAGSIISQGGQYADYEVGTAPADVPNLEEVPTPPPVPDPGMQQAPYVPMPQDSAEWEPRDESAPRTAVHRAQRDYPPMTMRPRQHAYR